MTPTRSRFFRVALAAAATAALAGVAVAAPTPGPTTVRLVTGGLLPSGSAVPLGTRTQDDAEAGDEFVTLTSVLGRFEPGDAVASAGAFLDGSPFAASVVAPRHFPAPTSPYVGGYAEVRIDKTFRKGSDESRLSFVYTDLGFQLGWEKEFGAKCPPNDPGCQWAGFRFAVDLWSGGDTPLWSDLRSVSVQSIGNAQSEIGYGISGDRLYPFTGTIGRTGADVYLPLPYSIEVDLSGVAVGEIFTVSSWLLMTAIDRGGEVGPGRIVLARAWDPLELEGGLRIDALGLTPWETIPSPVPEPPSWALALAALLLGPWFLRRRR